MSKQTEKLEALIVRTAERLACEEDLDVRHFLNQQLLLLQLEKAITPEEGTNEVA